MSAYLIQLPDSKVWHVGRFVYDDQSGPGTGKWRPECNLDPAPAPWRLRDGYVPPEESHLSWRTPHGICSNCAREVESAVRLIASEESR